MMEDPATPLQTYLRGKDGENVCYLRRDVHVNIIRRLLAERKELEATISELEKIKTALVTAALEPYVEWDYDIDLETGEFIEGTDIWSVWLPGSVYELLACKACKGSGSGIDAGLREYTMDLFGYITESSCPTCDGTGLR